MPTTEELLQQQAEINRQLKAAELNTLDEITTLMSEFSVVEFADRLAPLVEALPPGRAKDQGGNFLTLLRNGPRAFLSEKTKRETELAPPPAAPKPSERQGGAPTLPERGFNVTMD